MQYTVRGQIAMNSAQKAHDGAITAMVAKDFETALELFESEVASKKKALPASHPSILPTIYLIGQCHRMRGNKLQARDTFVELLHLQRQRLGIMHADCESTIESIIDLNNELGFANENEELARQLWESRTMTPSGRLEANLDSTLSSLELWPSLKEQLKQSHNAILIQKVADSASPPRTSRFLDPDWDPLEEARRNRQAKVEKDAAAAVEQARMKAVEETVRSPRRKKAPK